MAIQPGERVGAILKADKTTVHLLGYGVYNGREVPPEGLLHEFTHANPKITLDDGRVVWGYQCWWGPEAKVREMISNRTVLPATITYDEDNAP